jgi:hypothetical protein
VNASSAHTLIAPAIPPQSSPCDNWLAAFPLRSFLELGAYNTAPGSARGHTRNVLREWRLDDLQDAVLLVVSELITNAVAATSRGAWEAGRPPVRLWLLGSSHATGAGATAARASSASVRASRAGRAGEVMVLVWDAVTELPASLAADELDESGRGLWIVNRYSARSDVYLPPAPPGGKVVRALIDKPSPPGD